VIEALVAELSHAGHIGGDMREPPAVGDRGHFACLLPFRFGQLGKMWDAGADPGKRDGHECRDRNGCADPFSDSGRQAVASAEEDRDCAGGDRDSPACGDACPVFHDAEIL
jgi:hypothetical protein